MRFYSCLSAACSGDVSAACSADVSAACSADICNPGTARLRGSGLLAPWHRMATVACLMPASVCSCIARKRKFSTLSLRSAVENGSFSPALPELVNPLEWIGQTTGFIRSLQLVRIGALSREDPRS